jgi:hypothetical protein
MRPERPSTTPTKPRRPGPGVLGALLAVGILAAHLAVSPAAEAATMAIDAAGQGVTATVGGDFDVAIRLDGVPAGSDGKGLFGFGFSLVFDASAFSVVSVSIASSPWTGFADTSSTAGLASATANVFGSPSGPSGDAIPLATVRLSPLATGVFTLALATRSGVGDTILFDGTALDAASDFFGGASVTVVPEPRGCIALYGGLLALAARRQGPRAP